jgi:hypothetical protein
MTNDFDCEFDLPRPTKVKFAKIAFAGAAATVAVVGVLLSFALDSFKTALANVGVSAPSFLSFPTLVGGLAVLFVLVLLGSYGALTQYARRRILQYGS